MPWFLPCHLRGRARGFSFDISSAENKLQLPDCRQHFYLPENN